MIDLLATSSTEQLVQERKPVAPLPPSGADSRLGLHYLLRQCLASVPLLIADLSAVLIAVAILFGVANVLPVTTPVGLPKLALYLVITTTASFALLGQYPNLGIHPAVELKRLFLVVSVISLCLLATVELMGPQIASALSGIAIIWLSLAILVPIFRAVSRWIRGRFFRRWLAPILILGESPIAERLFESIDQHPSCGFRPIGIITNGQDQWFDRSGNPQRQIGTSAELAQIVKDKNVYWAIITDGFAFYDPEDDEDKSNRQVELPHRLYQATSSNFCPKMSDQVVTINFITYFKQTDRLLLPLPRLAKRVMDLILAIVVMIICAPLILALALGVKLTSRGPVVYRSKRVGRGNRVFMIAKFRSMFEDAEEVLSKYLRDHPELSEQWQKVQKLKNDPRVTPIGRLMRKTSLDELPQLINVFKGQMSLVGPRPIVFNEIERYEDKYPLYCRVRPGVTGMWQISGRNDTTYAERVAYDNFYVQNWTPWLDVYILARTFKVVFTGEGAY